MFEEMGYRDEAALDRMEAVSREYFGVALLDGTYRAWVAEDAVGQVMAGGGIVIAAWPGHPTERRGERAWILNIYTEPGARRLGLARRLMATMIEWCHEHGLSMVSLHASDAGRPLYETIGFEPTNEMRLKLQ
jgi:GNAT superfamily N-acetyltransferase